MCVKLTDAQESESDDTAILPETSYEVDIAQWMYEYVVMAIPMRHTHEEGECDEVMMSYLNTQGNGAQVIDTLWSALMDLERGAADSEQNDTTNEEKNKQIK